MNKQILITIIIMCILFSGCKSSQNIEASPIPTQKATQESISTPNPTLNTVTLAVSPTSSPTLTPTAEVKETSTVYISLPEVDASYDNDTIQTEIIVFDDEFMYYVDGSTIIKRNIKSNNTSIIYEGVYDNKYLSIQDGWLYFYTRGKGIIKVKTDGLKIEVIRNVQAEKVMVVGDNLYYYSVIDPFWDWPYALYKLDIKTKANNMVIRSGTDAKYANEKLYFTSYDGLVDCLETYNAVTKEREGTGVDCYSVPIIIDNIAYFFFDGGYWGDNSSLHINNIVSNEERIIDIDGHNLIQYFNYLLFIDSTNNLSAYDINDGKLYPLMPFKNKWINAINDDTLYIYAETDTESIVIYTMNLSEKAEMEKLCELNTNFTYENNEKDLSNLSEIEINDEWDDLKYSVFSYNYSRDRIDSIIYNDKKYSLIYEKVNENIFQNNIYVYDGEKENKIVENCAYTPDFPSFAIINDTIFYHVYEEPGYLYTYNLTNKKTNKYETGIGITLRFTPYYQYLIMDSYYKDYFFSFDNESELSSEELNPIYSIAFNMETEEFFEVENDLTE